MSELLEITLIKIIKFPTHLLDIFYIYMYFPVFLYRNLSTFSPITITSRRDYLINMAESTTAYFSNIQKSFFNCDSCVFALHSSLCSRINGPRLGKIEQVVFQGIRFSNDKGLKWNIGKCSSTWVRVLLSFSFPLIYLFFSISGIFVLCSFLSGFTNEGNNTDGTEYFKNRFYQRKIWMYCLDM